MITTKTALILGVIGMLGMSACREKPTCLNCEDVGEENANEDSARFDLPLPDLPCGGADLMTDNLNCGTCGHECGLSYPGTKYEAGGCHEGVCGLGGWTGCVSGPPWENCAELCNALATTCVPNGCAGITGMMFDVLFGEGCHPYDSEPLITLNGGCEQPIPWMIPTENHAELNCCCAFP